jgi:hypothetical protein
LANQARAYFAALPQSHARGQPGPRTGDQRARLKRANCGHTVSPARPGVSPEKTQPKAWAWAVAALTAKSPAPSPRLPRPVQRVREGGRCPGGGWGEAVDILYPLQYIPPACSPLCPMRLVCTVTVYSTVAKCNRPKWSDRSAARAAVRAVRSGPLLIVHGTIPYQNR